MGPAASQPAAHQEEEAAALGRGGLGAQPTAGLMAEQKEVMKMPAIDARLGCNQVASIEVWTSLVGNRSWPHWVHGSR